MKRKKKIKNLINIYIMQSFDRNITKFVKTSQNNLKYIVPISIGIIILITVLAVNLKENYSNENDPDENKINWLMIVVWIIIIILFCLLIYNYLQPFIFNNNGNFNKLSKKSIKTSKIYGTQTKK